MPLRHNDVVMSFSLREKLSNIEIHKHDNSPEYRDGQLDNRPASRDR